MLRKLQVANLKYRAKWRCIIKIMSCQVVLTVIFEILTKMGAPYFIDCVVLNRYQNITSQNIQFYSTNYLVTGSMFELRKVNNRIIMIV